MHEPSLTVVTGRPGSGKTTLAHALAGAIRRPVFCRDEFKEGFVGGSDIRERGAEGDVNREIYQTFFDVIEFVLSRGISLVAEAAFQHRLWAPRLEPLCRISNVAIVICTVDPGIARARFIERALGDPERKRFHGDTDIDADDPEIEYRFEHYDPPRLSVPTLLVNTADGYDPSLEQIASFAAANLSR